MDDDDVFPLDPEEPTPPKNDAAQHIADRLEKKNKQLEKEVAELREFKESQTAKEREASLSNVFVELGVDPKRTKYFKADNPDAEPTKEVVQNWAIAEGFLQQDEVEPVPSTGWTPPSSGEGVAPGLKRLSRQEWHAMANNPDTLAQAEKAWRDGRVDLSDVRVGMGQDK